MFWIHLATVIVVIGAFIGFFNGRAYGYMGIGRAISSALIGLLISGVVGAFGVDIAKNFAPEYAQERNRIEIIAAADGSMTKGSFFIFGGYIGEYPKYFYYKQAGDGGITQGNVSANKSTIYEDTVDEGYIVTYETCFEETYFTPAGCHSYSRTYDIHVPAGSVSRDFNFDLEK